MQIIAQIFRWLVVRAVQEAYQIVRRHPLLVLLLVLLAVLSSALFSAYRWAAISASWFARLLGWIDGVDALGAKLGGKESFLRKVSVAVFFIVVPGAIWLWIAAKVFDWCRGFFSRPVEVVTVVPVGNGALN